MKITPQEHDIDALGKHFDQEQIVELVATIATANLTCRMNEGLTVLTPQPRSPGVAGGR